MDGGGSIPSENVADIRMNARETVEPDNGRDNGDRRPRVCPGYPGDEFSSDFDRLRMRAT